MLRYYSRKKSFDLVRVLVKIVEVEIETKWKKCTWKWIEWLKTHVDSILKIRIHNKWWKAIESSYGFFIGALIPRIFMFYNVFINWIDAEAFQHMCINWVCTQIDTQKPNDDDDDEKKKQQTALNKCSAVPGLLDLILMHWFIF